jgi:subtilisin-like proprotein convertase family protein
VQNITVHDTTPPMLTCPAPVSVQCPTNVPLPDVVLVGVLDNCDSSPAVIHLGDVSTGVNPTIITRTYRATDACGNTNDCVQVITVEDTTAPSITACAIPSFIVGDTNGNAIMPDQRSQVIALDNCSAILITQVPAPGSMITTGAYVVTFTAIDSASNTSACTATLTVVAGAIPPTITMQPTNTTGECGSNIMFTVSVDGTAPFGYQWYFGTNTVLDATNALLEVTAVTAANAGSYSVIVTNEGGSITSSVVTLTVVDTIPALITCPAPLTVQCDADVPAPNFVGGSVVDGCDATPIVAHVADVTNGVCPKIITRTYRVTDASGNTNDCAQIITINDITPPTLVCPAPVTVQCDSDVPVANFAGGSANDNCGAMPVVTHISDVAMGSCPKTVTRTYRATDACGNTNDCTQIITISDTTPPTLACPVPVTVQCLADVPAVNTGSVTAADNCGAAPSVTHVSDSSSGTCPTIVTRTYRATDACGNTNDCVQLITIHDTTPPTLACPLPVTVECDADVPAVNVASVTAADNCGSVPVVTHVSDASSGSCPRIITRTYRATDVCGNTNDCAQIITVHDTTPPVANCSPNLTVKSTSTNGANVSFTVTATDNCTASPSVVCVPASGSLFPIGTSSVACTASDACGNTNACGFTVTVFLAASANIVVNEPVPDIPSLGLVSVLNVASPIGSLSDVNVTLNISNGWNGDLFAYLVHESGYAVLLNRVGKTSANPLGYSDAGMNITLDDQATNDVHTYRLSLFGNNTTPLAGVLTNSWQPDGRAEDPALVLDTTPRTDLLSAFNGMNPNGEWVLFVEDDAAGDISTLVSWGIELCGTLGVSPTITAPVQNVTVDCGNNAVFNVTATGTGPIGYHWLRNGVSIPGANAATYTINNATPADNATYSVIVSNAFGSVTSSATLVVNEPNLPVILTQPQSVTNNVGTTVSLSVAASSCSALGYQWCFGLTPLAGETNATLTIPNVQLVNQGGYSVKVSNAGGTTTSAVAVVTVNRLPVAQNNGGATIQGQALMIQVGKLLANDSDPDGDPLTVISVTATSTNGGSVVLGGGKVTYTPLPSFVGTDRYSYTISDGRGGTATADVEVLVLSGSLPSLNQIALIPTPNGFLIRFAGIPGYSYQIQRASTVTGPWSTITTQTAPLHGIIQYEDVNPPPGTGFYRTVAP